ncbi:hypothetical protein BDN67DRAFT_969216 [Paxillus ammoniavirescens]|nr:hypothetical protein BDN67DRAFT_969216 [Paxillus ammoniavirescens]
MASNVIIDPADIEGLRASQYLSAAGLVILLWDHLLTFQDEVQLIWQAKLSVPKVLFLFNRYAVPIAMIVQTQGFSGIGHAELSSTFCKAWFAIAVFIGMTSIAVSNFLVLLRLWALWDRSPQLMLWTLSLFILTQMVSLAFTGYVIHTSIPTLISAPILDGCTLNSKPPFAMLWSPGIAFEVMVFVTTFWNACDRPRQRDVQMAKVLYRDGCVYFLGLFVLRLVNLVLSIVAPLSLMFLGLFFIWSISNITLTRLILNLRRVSDRAEEDDLAGATELPVLHRHRSVQSYELQQKFTL